MALNDSTMSTSAMSDNQTDEEEISPVSAHGSSETGELVKKVAERKRLLCGQHEEDSHHHHHDHDHGGHAHDHGHSHSHEKEPKLPNFEEKR